MGPVPCIALRHIWDQSHMYFWDIYGTSPIDGSQIGMGLHHENFSMRSHGWLWDTYGTGPIYIDVRHLWDWSHVWLKDTYGTSPICNSEISMGPVPCGVLRHLWDRSHVWLSGTYGTGPIAHMGLQNITSNFQLLFFVFFGCFLAFWPLFGRFKETFCLFFPI